MSNVGMQQPGMMPGPGPVGPDDGQWRTQGFRQNMVSKINDVLGKCGAPTSKNAVEMENQVYSKANSKTEYLSFVARLILHIQEMKTKGQGPPGQMGATQMAQGQMMNQLNQIGLNQMQSPQMGGMVNGQQQQVVQMGQQQQQQMQMAGMGMGQGQIQMRVMGPGGQQMQGMGMVQGQQQGMQGMMPQQHQGQQGNMIVGQPGQQVMNQNQMQMGQGQMMNPNFMNQQMNQGQMQGMNAPQMQQQAMQQAMLQQQQHQEQQQGVGRGMRMPGMQKMQHMPRGQPMQHRQMNPGMGNMGMHRSSDLGPNYPLNRLNYFGSQQVDGGGMTNQFNQPNMQRSVGQFLPPNASPGMANGPGMAGTPSPNSMHIQGQSQQGFINSPQPLHPHGSPAPPGSMRAFGNQMVPSPSANLNTPMPMVPTPSPRNAEELACMKKIEELRRYTDMIQRMIVKIGNEDTEKSSKMKKLLDILLNPNQRVSMEILLKCEIALKKMEKQQHDAGPTSQPTMPPKDQVSPFLQIQEALLTTLKNGTSSHTFLRTFRPSVESLTGQSAIDPDAPDDLDYLPEDDMKSEIPSVLLREMKLMGRRFPLTLKRQGPNLPIQLNALIGDPKLPRVPFLKVVIPMDYPDESPSLLSFNKDYNTTPFLKKVLQAMKSRMLWLPNKFTVYELLVAWEMTVRSLISKAASPIGQRKPIKRILPTVPKITGRLGLTFI